MSRAQQISKIKAALVTDGYPRLQMLLLVGLTGGAGFLCSYGLLHAGLHTIWVRYLLAMGGAYLAFLFLLWLWLRWPRIHLRDLADTLDPTDLLHVAGKSKVPLPGGGRFGGAGASMAFEAPANPVAAPLLESVADSGGGADIVEGAVDAASGTDELFIPILVILLVLTLLLSSLWLIWSAPVLFSELLVDGALSAGLYRRLSHLPRRHWLETAVRRTIWPFLITTILVVAIGYGMNQLVPEAKSIGEFLAAASSVS